MNISTIFARARVGAGLTAFAVGLLLAVGPVPALASFGFAALDGQLSASPAGEAYTQAGGHPYALSTFIAYNTHPDEEFFGLPAPDGMTKDILTSLPPGLVGNPEAVGTCPWEKFIQVSEALPECPESAQVGIVDLPLFGGHEAVPVYNLQTPAGVPARLGFDFLGTAVVLDASVRPQDYGIDINARDISEAIPFHGVRLIIWGTPADPSHDAQRCPQLHPIETADEGPDPAVLCQGAPGEVHGPHSSELPPIPYLTLPTRCTAEGEGLETRVRMDSWEEPGVFQEASFVTHRPPFFPAEPAERGAPVGTTGCSAIPFEPAVHVSPTTTSPGTPSGMNLAIALPTSGLESQAGVAQSNLKKVVLRFPAGMALNPAAAAGLGACSEAQIAIGSDADASCPESSKLGTVTIDTPLLKEPLTGAIYQATQGANPFHATFVDYLVAKGPGVNIKLPGLFHLDPSSGQITVTFDNAPQLPFSNLQVSVKDGPRAPFVTPASCGEKAITAEVEGWSGKTVSTSSPFTVECQPGLGGFAPGFTAGMASNAGAGYGQLTLTVTRKDGEQDFGAISERFPPGLLGSLKDVPRCGESQAAQGTCGPESLIGHTTVAAGAGTNPLYLGGQVFLTGPYKGAPFGLSVLVPAIAGPFNLGNVVVRAALSIDPTTSQVTVTSDPLPTILQGVLLDLRAVHITIDREHFMFNPTNCEPFSIDGTLASAQGVSVPVSNHFQAADCATLKFKPSFKASTQGNDRIKGLGASLDVKIATGQGPGSDEANIRKVEVQLPKILPSRLTTLQKACTEQQFAANPSGCPSESNVGSATAITPILANALAGPAYLVSHGNEAFPDLVLVLQGEGITLEVTGHTQIKGGVTYSRFETVPDAPLSSFELKLPQGSFSALGAVTSPCGKTVRTSKRVRRHGHTRLVHKTKRIAANLNMPTTITAQNGAVIKQTTKIAVTGCPRATAGARSTRRARHA
jgi:hypothetical protein